MSLEPVAWLFVSILVTFVVTRAITRFIRHRGATGGGAGPLRDLVIGGVHIHHQVFGIAIMLLGGLDLIAYQPKGSPLDAAAAFFGVGVALTFDEFALWLHLEDVYWSQTGRLSVDAVFIVLIVTGALIGGAELVAGPVGSTTWWTSIAGLVVTLVLGLLCILKGKVFTAVIGLFVLPVLVAGVWRLAKPDSWWARRWYADRPKKLARARRRFGPRYEARWNRLKDFIAGAPTQPGEIAPVPPPPLERVERVRH
jgi:hypothetical protein